jgi:hypothetical protein
MIRTECTLCSEQYRLRDDFAGRMVRCRACGGGFAVPVKKTTERFARFLARAPKPTEKKKRERGVKRELPARPPLVAAPSAPKTSSRLHLVGGLALMAFTSAMVFFVATAALG